ncbi:MAG TPA: acyl-CoA thioesterase [Paludibacter sp.]|nr:acyl-CoA thioesterase [Paludibacter sp.]
MNSEKNMPGDANLNSPARGTVGSNPRQPYELEFKVRDYECDLQGVVNNSVYQNYFEHTRHEYLLDNNVSFDELHQQGVDAMVARIEIAYKTPLKSGDSFISKLSVQKDGIKYVFHQVIHRKGDDKICAKAKVDTVVVVNGKLSASHPVLDGLLAVAE